MDTIVGTRVELLESGGFHVRSCACIILAAKFSGSYLLLVSITTEWFNLITKNYSLIREELCHGQ